MTWHNVDPVKAGTRLHVPGEEVWRAGDVVDVRFRDDDIQSYTYVRGSRDWPAPKRPLSDTRINELWAAGRIDVVRKK